jgi:type II restriction enzyme
LINNYLEPQAGNWVEELVYRFLLTRGDTLGGMMRNIAGVLAQRKVTRAMISTLAVTGATYQWLDASTNKWLPKPEDDSDIELRVKGLGWTREGSGRCLLFNIKVPSVNKNVDLCLFNRSVKDVTAGKRAKSLYKSSDLYLALGELKGGIDPAGADEHWKTAYTALGRIQKSFSEFAPHLFFIGAAIEKDMANEIWRQLETSFLSNAANLTNEDHVASICLWLCRL